MPCQCSIDTVRSRVTDRFLSGPAARTGNFAHTVLMRTWGPGRERGVPKAVVHLAAGLGITVLAACGTTRQENPEPPSDTAPTVMATLPQAGASEVALDQPLVVDFSEAMDERSVELALRHEPPLDCDYVWRRESSRLVCDPRFERLPLTTYQVSISTSATDTAGNRLAGSFGFSYTTSDEVMVACKFGSADALFGSCIFGP